MTTVDLFGPPPDELDEFPHDVTAEQYLLSAMMQSAEATDAAIDTGWHPRDMYRPQHEVVAAAIIAMVDDREPCDPITLADRLSRADAWQGDFQPAYLHTLYAQRAMPTAAHRYAETVHDLAIRRRMLELSARTRQQASRGALSSLQLIAETEAYLANVAGDLDGAQDGESLAGLLGEDTAHQYRWVVEGLIDAQDRVVVVAEEGQGKSVLGGQVAFTIAAGVHPFWNTRRIPARKVAYIDLEAPRGVFVRRMRWMAEIAQHTPGWDPRNLVPWHKPDGLDLRTADGQHRFTAFIRRHRPALVVVGPLYKMGLDEAQREEHKLVSDYLDRLRARFDVALWIESHAPLQSGPGGRLMRPMGSGLWTRWPEFGFAYTAAKNSPGAVTWGRFRKDRETGRPWPIEISQRQGFGWPWEATFGSAEDSWHHPAPPAGGGKDAAAGDETARSRQHEPVVVDEPPF